MDEPAVKTVSVQTWSTGGSKAIQVRPQVKEKGSQTRHLTRSIGVQCDMSQPNGSRPRTTKSRVPVKPRVSSGSRVLTKPHVTSVPRVSAKPPRLSFEAGIGLECVQSLLQQ